VSVRQPSTFDLYPAIDLRGGRVVRLRQGDFAREQVYHDDPAGVAIRFAAAGAAWLHVVDLDGARAGESIQSRAIAAIADATRQTRADRVLRLQVAGGLRNGDAISAALAAGATRVVIGTAALAADAVVADAIARHGTDRIAIALDVRDGIAVGDGWVAGAAGEPVDSAIGRLSELGVETFIVTAIERDGLLGGPDLGLLGRAIRGTDAAVIASGGVASVADLLAVRAIGCAGAIVGRALYDGRIDLADALAVLAASDIVSR
jgi:phosphoribosylformimino-5-aminoimidazole carboxamide ribotide isomerase